MSEVARTWRGLGLMTVLGFSWLEMAGGAIGLAWTLLQREWIGAVVAGLVLGIGAAAFVLRHRRLSFAFWLALLGPLAVGVGLRVIRSL